jgi:hypothetical protein
MSNVFHIGLEEALVSDNPVERMMARGAASSWVDRFQAWVSEEFSRTSGDTGLQSDLIIAVGKLMIATHSSFIANFMSEGGFPVVAEAMKDFIDQEYVRHAMLCRTVIQEQRGGHA